MEEVAYYYRFENFLEADYDPWGEYEAGTSHTVVRLRRFEVWKTTPKGVWIIEGSKDGWHTRPKFVLATATKRFACPTIEEAKVSFLARKTAQISFLRRSIKRAQESIQILEGNHYREPK